MLFIFGVSIDALADGNYILAGTDKDLNLLRHNEPITKIVELTGLSISEIEKLKKQHL